MYDFMNKFPHPGFNQVPEYSEKKISSHIKKFKDSFDRLADEHIRKIQIFKSN
jgi:hypothetical protein